ncbi:putative tartrate transporter [Tolypocladium ophioglossoides CBS 100239]|uniref:Putative tartrate transporter n=1 Tax=Tolypocladium ophioglossoides (strain CBS 100239) TaxID=1163406 RepID=A0A0L0NAD9_TOLOC|nr:putative tartrate transporter [Tolypocladium ophioglossoides CBS 100239]
MPTCEKLGDASLSHRGDVDSQVLKDSNIGNAKILNSSTRDDMQASTSMSDYQFAIALTVFLVAYAVLEVPSNMLLEKLSHSRWIAFLMLCWGAMTMSLGGMQSFAGVKAMRFLPGMFEAGRGSEVAQATNNGRDEEDMSTKY